MENNKNIDKMNKVEAITLAHKLLKQSFVKPLSIKRFNINLKETKLLSNKANLDKVVKIMAKEMNTLLKGELEEKTVWVSLPNNKMEVRGTGKYCLKVTCTDKYYDKSMMLIRWSQKLLDKFFPTPTRETQNPCYHCAEPRKLYSQMMVEKIERTTAFQKAFAKSHKRMSDYYERISEITPYDGTFKG